MRSKLEALKENGSAATRKKLRERKTLHRTVVGPMLIPHVSSHDFVKFVYKEMAERNITSRILSDACKGQITTQTIRTWKNVIAPDLNCIEIALHALGYKLVIVPLENDNADA